MKRQVVNAAKDTKYQYGYMLVTLDKKGAILHLWDESKEELEEWCEPGMQIVPYYKDDQGGCFLLVDGKCLRLEE